MPYRPVFRSRRGNSQWLDPSRARIAVNLQELQLLQCKKQGCPEDKSVRCEPYCLASARGSGSSCYPGEYILVRLESPQSTADAGGPQLASFAEMEPRADRQGRSTPAAKRTSTFHKNRFAYFISIVVAQRTSPALSPGQLLIPQRTFAAVNWRIRTPTIMRQCLSPRERSRSSLDGRLVSSAARSRWRTDLPATPECRLRGLRPRVRRQVRLRFCPRRAERTRRCRGLAGRGRSGSRQGPSGSGLPRKS